jgi:AbrB family looped-hinge helix DNA binding protein
VFTAILKIWHYGINGKMEAVTKIDRAGRVVIPKEIRERMELKEGSSLLISESNRGVLILKKLDIEEMARRLRQELKGVNVEGIAKRIEVESNERARKEHKILRS